MADWPCRQRCSISLSCLTIHFFANRTKIWTITIGLSRNTNLTNWPPAPTSALPWHVVLSIIDLATFSITPACFVGRLPRWRQAALLGLRVLDLDLPVPLLRLALVLRRARLLRRRNRLGSRAETGEL